MEGKIVNKFLVIFLLIFSTSCLKDWDYKGRKGPNSWGDLKEEYKFCKIGYNQSPIDVKYKFKDEKLKFFYSPSEATKIKKEHNLQIEVFGRDHLKRGRKEYFIRYIDFHHPSEHLKNGKAYSLEMQVMHKSLDEQYLILSYFLDLGEENKNFDHLVNFLEQKEVDGEINLSKIIKRDKLFFYDGSFITPPCKEGVKWYVAKTPVKISKEQMNKIIKSAIFTTPNSRPVQDYHPEKF